MPQRILVVDDDPMVRDVLRRFLAAGDYEVTSVDDGDAAMKALRREPPDLVLLDLDMPRLNGLEVLRRLMAEQIAVNVLVLSGHFDEKAFDVALDLGAKGYLRKPFDFETLESTVKHHLAEPDRTAE